MLDFLRFSAGAGVAGHVHMLTGSGGNGEIPGHRFALDASIVRGTGAYKNLRRIGTATAQFGPNTTVSITTPNPIGGVLTLNLSLRPPVR